MRSLEINDNHRIVLMLRINQQSQSYFAQINWTLLEAISYSPHSYGETLMLSLIAFVHIIIGILIVIVVLLQDSKGGAMGILGGGGSNNSLFGSAGATSFLGKVTRWLGIIFAATCVSLAYISTVKKGSVLDSYEPSQSIPSSTGKANDSAPAKKTIDDSNKKSKSNQ